MENLREFATFKPELAKIITLDRKSKESVTSNPLLNQKKHKSLL